MSKFRVGDRVSCHKRQDPFDGTVLVDREDITGFILVQRDDGCGWASRESFHIKRHFPHLLGLDSLWWVKEADLVLGGPKPIFDGYDIDA